MIVSKKIWVTAALVLGMSVTDVVASTLEEGNWVAVCDNVGQFVCQRPKKSERLFKSDAVEKKIQEVKKMLTNPYLAWMFENCFPNTLDTTVHYRKLDGEDDTFVYTGDIHAMWLRDSGAQVWPYVQLANEDPELKKMLRGVILRQFKCIHFDPYANAFNDGPTGGCWQSDITEMKPELHERKYEIDSLCYPVRLAYHYWQVTGDHSIFTSGIWEQVVESIVRTFKEQQRKEGPGPYRFQRVTETATDTVENSGWGHPVNPVGLIVSVFRPSDDATTFPFLVPSNFFAVTSLRKAAEILTTVNKNEALAKEKLRASQLQKQIFENTAKAYERCEAVLQVMLPGRDGVELLKMMKTSEAFRQIP